MDMRQYAGDLYLGVEDVRSSGPKQLKIESIEEGQFDKPVARFNDGSLLSVNATNCKTLVRVYGVESSDWIGKIVELYVGETMFSGKPRDSVLIKPISPAIPVSERTAPKPAPDPRDISDDIPF